MTYTYCDCDIVVYQNKCRIDASQFSFGSHFNLRFQTLRWSNERTQVADIGLSSQREQAFLLNETEAKMEFYIKTIIEDITTCNISVYNRSLLRNL